MFTFSTQHPWQVNDAVQQILVFTSVEMKKLFDVEMASRLAKAMDAYAGVDPDYETQVKETLSDSGAGAIYRLRAVRTYTGEWAAIIRCGFTGAALWEQSVAYSTSETALVACIVQLKASILRLEVPAELLKTSSPAASPTK